MYGVTVVIPTVDPDALKELTDLNQLITTFGAGELLICAVFSSMFKSDPAFLLVMCFYVDSSCCFSDMNDNVCKVTF